MNNVLDLNYKLQVNYWLNHFKELNNRELMDIVIAEHYTNSLVKPAKEALKEICSKKSIYLKQYFEV